jgi:CheY-specific phosphatase CheX
MMHTLWKEELFQAAVLTFEELCFLLPDPELQESQRQAPVDLAVRIAFSGPFRGHLLIKVCGGLLPMLAANMLGQAETPPAEQQHDALGEVANVVCGNLLPRIAGPKEVFQLGPPQLVECSDATPDNAVLLAAEVQVGVAAGRIDLLLFADGAVVS